MVNTHNLAVLFGLFLSGRALNLPDVMPQAIHPGSFTQTQSELSSELLAVSPEVTPSDAKVAAMVNIGGLSMSAAQLTYYSSFLAMFGIVVVLYWFRGTLTILRILAYLTALSTIMLTIKNIYSNYHYNFPKVVSFAHFVACGAVCFTLMAVSHLKEGKPFPVPTVKEQLTGICPVAASFALSIGFNNMALSYAGAGFVEMMGSTTLLWVVMLTLAMGKAWNGALNLPLVVVSVGVCMCATGELRFSTLGILFALGASLMRALKGVLQAHLLIADDECNRTKLEPHELLAWMSIPSAAIMLGWSLMTDGAAPFVQFVTHDRLLGLVLAISISCANAVILNLSNLFVVKDLGAVGVNVTGQLKGIMIILGGVAVLGESVQMMQIIGFGTVVGGCAWYNMVEKGEKEAVEKKLGALSEKTTLVNNKVV